MPLRRLNDRIAVLTGAASGIGRATAYALAEEGCHLVLSDVDADGLDETARVAKTRSGGKQLKISTHVVDVSDRDAMQAFAKAVEDEHGHVHIVINNAGVTVAGEFENQTLDDFKWVVDINLWGVVYGSKFFLPLLQRAGEGCIVNLSSMFGLVGVPMQTSYCATKFAVRGFSESLAAELVDQHIDVVSVHPGGISTRIVHNSRQAGEKAKRSQRKLEKFFEKKAMPASEAAAKIVKGIKRGSPRVLITKETYATDYIKRVFPALPPRLVSRARKLMGVD